MPATVSLLAATGIINARQHGARGGARKVLDAHTTNGSHTVTSATGGFTAADVGKVAWVWGTTTLLVAKSIITAVNSSTSIELSNTAATTQTTGYTLIWGWDDTEALREAAAAADVSNQKLVLPDSYVVSGPVFYQDYAAQRYTYAIEGAGSGATVFYPTPDFDFTDCYAGNGMLFRVNNALYQRVKGLKVDCYRYTDFDWKSNTVFPMAMSASRSIFEDVHSFSSKDTGTGFLVNGNTQVLINCHSEDHGQNGMDFKSCSATVVGGYSGNNLGTSVLIQDITEDGIGLGLNFDGFFIDESTAGQCHIYSSKGIYFDGVKCWAQPNIYTVALHANSELKVDNSHIAGVYLEATTSKIYASKTAFLNPGGAAYAYNNAAGGEIHDLGGCTWGNAVTGTKPNVSKVTAAGAINTKLPRCEITGPASSTYAATLAAPAAGDVEELAITMVATTSTNSVTLALTNVEGGSNTSTATFDAARETLVLRNNGAKWLVVKEFGVTLS